MDKLKEVMQAELKTGFASVEENINKEVATKIDGVTAEMKDFKTQLDAISGAKAVVDVKTNISEKTLARAGEAFKGLFSQDADVRAKADVFISGSTTGDGEELMHIEMHKGILTLAQSFGVLNRDAVHYSTTERTYKITFGKYSTDHGQRDVEGASQDTDKETFGTVSPTLTKWRKFIAVTEEAIKFSNSADLGAYIVMQLAMHQGKFIEAEIATALAGSADAPVKVGATGAVGVPTYEELVAMQELPEFITLANSAYYMNLATWNKVKLEQDTAGSYLVTQYKPVLNTATGKPVQGQAVGAIDQFAVYLVPEIADTGLNAESVIFGDMSNSVAVVEASTFEITNEFVFRTDITEIKGKHYSVVQLLHDGATTRSAQSAYALYTGGAS
ncbi:MAG: phage major capsid protein [Gammaproteobacteria bacterium]|nr:phage major capsid protein [Gammaproteobacteria bacterium]